MKGSVIMGEIYSKIRVKARSRKASMEIDGDLFSTDVSYRRAVDLAIRWKPSKKIKTFVDRYIPEFRITDDFGHIAIIRKYPKSFAELAEYVLKGEDPDYIGHVIATKSYISLKQILLLRRNTKE